MSTILGLDVQVPPGRPPMLQVPDADPRWVTAHREALRHLVTTHGALLVRGLGLHDPTAIGTVFAQLGDSSMVEREAFAPRAAYQPGVYAATTWPAKNPMCLHHELSYAVEFPGLMMFACRTPAVSGGATAVADAAAVLDALPRGLVERFAQEGWLLVRNYNDEIGASWAEAFGTDDRGAVEGYCRASGIDLAWQPDGGLRTWQRRYAVVRHPVTGVFCWFNQVAFLNEWTLEPEVREYLVDVFGPDGLPFTTRFGHGAPIGDDVVQLINEVYAAHTRRVAWQAGDLLLVDNIRTAHGREAYEGAREVLVALADPVRITDCDPGAAR